MRFKLMCHRFCTEGFIQSTETNVLGVRLGKPSQMDHSSVARLASQPLLLRDLFLERSGHDTGHSTRRLLVGGFKHFLFPPQFGEGSHFD